MKNKLVATSVREIKNSFPRFLSLLIMSFLGLFCFVGLKSTAPDMIYTLDNYLDNQNTYDISLTSPLGFNEQSLEILKSIADIKDIEGLYSSDVLIKSDDHKFVLNIANLPENINKLEILDGRLPTSPGEIVVEQAFIEKSIYKIGDTISFTSSDVENNLKIVGIVRSPLYFASVEASNNQGTSQIGAGIVNFYSFALDSCFKMDGYSSIAITIKNAKELETNSNEYNNLIDDTILKLDETTNTIALQRRDEIVEKREKDLSEARKLLDDGNLKIDATIIFFKTLGGDFSELTRDNVSDFIDNLKDTPNSETLISALEEIQKQIEEINKQEIIYQDGMQNLNKIKNLSDNDFLNSIYATKILTRLDWTTYKDYITDTESVNNLSLIFPIVFFTVAVLISLISMNRMVEDDRGLIGTLKSLGFSNYHIMLKYLIFSLLAVFVGGLLGAGLGIIILPNLIFSIYGLLFDLPYFIIKVNYIATILGFMISAVCICGTTILTLQKVLYEKPSALLRPRAPKIGKKIFLERFTKFWSHLKFSQKVTIRNIFRYKKRVLITIGGITGCTALILCGFGLRDSIVDIPQKQYENVFRYDAMTFVNLDNEEEKDALFSDFEEIKEVIACETISTKVDKYDVSLVIPENIDSFKNAVNFSSLEGEHLELEKNKVIISDKLAELTKLSKGEKITFLDQNKEKQSFEISGIMENYAQHFIFMDPTTFLEMDGEYKTNVIYLTFNRELVKDYDDLNERLMNLDQVVSVTMIETFIDMVDDMLQSLNKVVIILIVLASILSFVVMYNLSNINIAERKREIATLKVLGFYNREVDNYITKENIILTLIGMALGLILGLFLTNFVVMTVEIESIRFIHQISPFSFIISGVITILFTYIVNFITHFSLKKIDMIESLKSVE